MPEGVLQRGAGPLGKVALKLAREVRDAGYVVRLTGKSGHSFGIWPAGTPDPELRLATALFAFVSHPKNETTVYRARVKLVKLGILPGAKRTEEVVMAVPKAANVENTPALVARLRAQLDALGGDSAPARKQLAERAVEILRFRAEQGLEDVEQFGSTGAGKTPPRDVARESLRGLLDLAMNATDKSWARWSTVLDEIEGAASEAPVLQAVEAPTVIEDADPLGEDRYTADLDKLPPVRVDTAEAVPTPDAGREEFEELLRLVEVERDQAKGERDQAQGERDLAQRELGEAKTYGSDQADRLRVAEEQLGRALRELDEVAKRALDAEEQLKTGDAGAAEKLALVQGELRDTQTKLGEAQRETRNAVDRERRTKARLDKAGSKDETVTSLRAQLESERHDREMAEQAQASQLLERDAAWQAQLAERTDQLTASRLLVTEAQGQADAAEMRAGRLELELQAQEPRTAILEALLQELQDCNGSPRPWLLERLDRLAGL